MDAVARPDGMAPGTLARFSFPGMTWPEILKVDPLIKKSWWRKAIMHAEDDGWIAWDAKGKRWKLTPAGHRLVLGVS